MCYHDHIRVKKFLRGHRFKFENKGLRKGKTLLRGPFTFPRSGAAKSARTEEEVKGGNTQRGIDKVTGSIE